MFLGEICKVITEFGEVFIAVSRPEPIAKVVQASLCLICFGCHIEAASFGQADIGKLMGVNNVGGARDYGETFFKRNIVFPNCFEEDASKKLSNWIFVI